MTAHSAGALFSVNLGTTRAATYSNPGVTGIGKRPTADPVAVRAPGADGASGVVGDAVCDLPAHGGTDKAVYAYAREDLDAWGARLNRSIPPGSFGENLTTVGLDVTGAVIGERWRIGAGLLVEVCQPRIPCRTFAGWLDELGWTDGKTWMDRFIEAGDPGAYLRVIEPGTIRVGDPVEIVYRPEHDVTIGVVYRARTTQPELLPRLLSASALPERLMEKVRRRLAEPELA
jgi:MOSC domain-containing protein YiiM